MVPTMILMLSRSVAELGGGGGIALTLNFFQRKCPENTVFDQNRPPHKNSRTDLLKKLF